MFAAITLGGLGTAFGALVGGLVIGLLTSSSATLWIAAGAQERRRARGADPRPAGPTAGHPRTQGAGRIGDGLGLDPLATPSARAISAATRSSSRSPRSASTSTSATPACSTSARSAFMAVGAYGVGITDRQLRLAAVGRHPGRLVLVGRARRSCSACPTLRLRADYLAIVTIAAAEILRLIVRSAPLQRCHRWRRTASTASPTLPATGSPQPVRHLRADCTASDRSRFSGADICGC